MAKIGLTSPWVTYYHKVEALFKNDNDITVVYDEANNNLKIYVAGIEGENAKADALTKLLPTEKIFGDVVMPISVIPANKRLDPVEKRYAGRNGRRGYIGETSCELAELYRDIFNDNVAFYGTKVISGIFTNDLVYVIFEPVVAQYYSDALDDYKGICSTLYQNLAKDIFINQENVFFCTVPKTARGVGVGGFEGTANCEGF